MSANFIVVNDGRVVEEISETCANDAKWSATSEGALYVRVLTGRIGPSLPLTEREEYAEAVERVMEAIAEEFGACSNHTAEKVIAVMLAQP